MKLQAEMKLKDGKVFSSRDFGLELVRIEDIGNLLVGLKNNSNLYLGDTNNNHYNYRYSDLESVTLFFK